MASVAVVAGREEALATTSITLFGKQLSGPFTIPSGCVSITTDTLSLLAKRVSAIGVLTTKSIGPVERAGSREPVYASLPSCNKTEAEIYVNAVSLANPGADAFANELKEISLGNDKVLIVSIFGGTTEDFQYVAEAVSPYADALELNFSCPHAAGYGQAICATPTLAAEVLRSVQKVTKLPLIPKLSPNLSSEQLDPLVVSLIDAGAAGFTAINTVGPVDNIHPLTGTNVLANGRGGQSGPGIIERGVQVVSELKAILVREGRSELPIIGMGGIATATDVERYRQAGATIFGVGSALTGLSTDGLVNYFTALEAGNPDARIPLPEDYMSYRKFTLAKTTLVNSGLGIFLFNEPLPCRPGQFVEVWIPGVGEKPFAQATESSFSLAVRDVGILTKHFFSLTPGDAVYVRGPYGKGFSVPASLPPPTDHFVLVGGGTGIAPLLLLAEHLSKAGVPNDRIIVYLGGRSHDQVYFLDEFARYATVRISTDDGSTGFHGFVTQLLEVDLKEQSIVQDVDCRYHFYNCGPEIMMKIAYGIQQRFNFAAIECSVERYMKCGVGICGVCACDGSRTCVDGPVFPHSWLAQSSMFGHKHRAKTGKLIDWNEPFNSTTV